MRYMVFGDVHANALALQAALDAARQRGAQAYMFVGDLLGYGPDPVACVEMLLPLLKGGQLAWVTGNHDLVVRGDFEPDGYTPEAASTLHWTRMQVCQQPAVAEFLATGRLLSKVGVAGGAVWLTHDSIVDPSRGTYHRSPQNALTELRNLQQRGGRVCFYGHTHFMRAETLQQQRGVVLHPLFPHSADTEDPNPLQLPEDAVAWICTGSVGFPINKNRQAEFLIFDDQAWTIEKYAVDYPRQAARTRIRDTLGAHCGNAIAERIARWL